MSDVNGKTTGMIVFVSGVRGDTRRYRTIHPGEQLQSLGAAAVVSHTTDPRLPGLIAHAGVVVFHRVACDGYIEGLIRELRKRGGLAIFDADDLTFDPQAFQWIDSPDFEDPIRARLYQEDMRRNRQTLDLCDAALASTSFLGRHFQALGKMARVHRNGFSQEMLRLSEAAFRQRPASPERVVIGYASGTPTHNRDFAIVRTALQRVLRRFPQTELRLVGPVDPGEGWEGAGERIRRVPLVPWQELPGLLAQFDINLAPLVCDNAFAQSKSEIKFMEAALVRVPTIASPIEAFSESICSGQNGWLANTSEDWDQALTAWVEDRAGRLRIADRAYADVLAGYHPGTRGKQLIETLEALSGDVDGQTLRLVFQTAVKDGLQEETPADPSLSQMAGYTLRHRGVKTLLQQEWIYLRRLLAPALPFRRGGGR
jgi:glycosyltransferase involved in cell wall biosynthesis